MGQQAFLAEKRRDERSPLWRLRSALVAGVGIALFVTAACNGKQSAAERSSTEEASASAPVAQSEDWRAISEGVDGYPAGPMLEIALRRTHGDRLEMFRWRSEFISMLSAQPGALVEREWRSISGIPENAGAGTWTGMTWWENQQRWQDMANMLFPSPVTQKWLQTIHMTLVFVKPRNEGFDLRTLAQSGEQVLELGILAFASPSDRGSAPPQADAYLNALAQRDVEVHRFDIYPNPQGAIGPYTTAYNRNGPPNQGEGWFVYMASYASNAAREALQGRSEIRNAFAALQQAIVAEHSDFQVMTRSTSKVCCQAAGTCSLDPEECDVGMMGAKDLWAGNCNQCPKPCLTGHDICSHLSPQTCVEVGGTPVETCPAP